MVPSQRFIAMTIYGQRQPPEEPTPQNHQGLAVADRHIHLNSASSGSVANARSTSIALKMELLWGGGADLDPH